MAHNLIGTTRRTIRDFLEQPGLIPSLGLLLWRIYNDVREWVVPSRRLARRLDREFDPKYGLKTKGFIRLSELEIEGNSFKLATPYYQAVRPSEFQEVLNKINISHEDFVFFDYGSGMGRALLLASELPFKKIIGVEFSSELHEIAQENIRKYKSKTQRCTDIESVCMDALDYPIPEENVVFYLYNPFREELMGAVLDKIQKSLEKHPRRIYILYVNPRCIDVFDRFAFDLIKASKYYAVFSSSVHPGSASSI